MRRKALDHVRRLARVVSNLSFLACYFCAQIISIILVGLSSDLRRSQRWELVVVLRSTLARTDSTASIQAALQVIQSTNGRVVVIEFLRLRVDLMSRLSLWLDLVVLRGRLLRFLLYRTRLNHQVWIRVRLWFYVRGLLSRLFVRSEMAHCIRVDPVGTAFFIFWGVEELIIVALFGEDLRAPGVSVSDSRDIDYSPDRVE